jgi:uncharacterized protein (TIGR00251 family)
MQAKSLNGTEIVEAINQALKEESGTLYVSVHLQPKASKTEFAGMHGDALKVRVAAPAVENAANEAILEFFSKVAHIPKRNARLHSGKASRRKVIALEGVSAMQFLQSINAHLH